MYNNANIMVVHKDLPKRKKGQDGVTLTATGTDGATDTSDVITVRGYASLTVSGNIDSGTPNGDITIDILPVDEEGNIKTNPIQSFVLSSTITFDEVPIARGYWKIAVKATNAGSAEVVVTTEAKAIWG